MADAAQIEFSDPGLPDQLEVSADWRFVSIAIQTGAAGAVRGESDCWLKKDEFSDWQKIENTGDFWRLFAPLLGVQTSTLKHARPFRWRVLMALCGVTVLALAALGGIYWKHMFESARDLLAAAPRTEFSTDIEDGLAKAVAGIRPGLPKRIDPMTNLMWVSYSGTKMIYDNRLEIEGAKVDDVVKKKLTQLIIVNTCGSAPSRKLLDLGGSFRYVYSDIYAKVVLTLDVDKDKCGP